MRFPDITKSHIDSPDFKRDLRHLERDTDSLAISCQSIITILAEKASLARRDVQLTKQLIRDIQSVGMSHIVGLEEEELSGNSSRDTQLSHERISKKISAFTTISAQLCENQEIFSEQIEIGLIQPLKLFINTQLAPVINMREEYKSVCRKINLLQDRFSQFKRHEISQMGELSYQLFDTKIYKHQLVCKYLSNLHSLHTCRLQECLERLTQYLLTSSSYHNLCSSLLGTSQESISSLYKASQSISETIQGTQRRVELDSERIIAEVAQDLAIGLLNFQVSDVHLPYPTALANTRRHLSINRKNLPPISPEIFTQSPTMKPRLASDSFDTSEAVKRLAKCGYLNCGETKTFSVTWKRHFFWIESNGLMQYDNRTNEQKFILNLKLSTVKSVTTTEVDRNFCFKVISPTLTLLMQADSSRDVEEWVEAISSGIRQAFNSQRTTTVSNVFDTRTDNRRNSQNLPESPLTPITGISIQTLSEIYAMPGNDKCVDCLRRAPKWASINLGIVLCIDCSGHHRGLGVHLSQIRSLILDSIKPEWIFTISSMGNTKFNSVFEANLSEEVKIELVKNEKNLKEFITDKYQNLKFCAEEERNRILEEREKIRLQNLEKYCSDKEFDLVTQYDIDNNSKIGVKKQFEGLVPSRSPSPKFPLESSFTHSTSTDSLRNKVKIVSGSIGQTIARIGTGKKS